MPVFADLQSFVDHLPIGVFRLEKSLQGLYVNHRMLEFMGLPPGSPAHATNEGFAPELRARLIALARSVLQTGEPREIEFPLEARGRTRTVQLRLVAERNSAGEITHAAGVAFDITESKRLAEALRQSEARFKAFMDHIPMIAWIKDEHGRYLFVNHFYEATFGFDGGQWRGRTDFELLPEEFAQRCRQEELDVLDGEGLGVSVGVLPDRGGALREWHLMRFAFQDPDGARYLGGIASDVTERRQLERALKASEQRLKNFIDSSPVLVWMKDEQGRYVYLSRSFENYFKVSFEDWRGRTDFDFWPAEEAEKFRVNDQVVLDSQRTVEGVDPTTDPDGVRRYWWVFKFPFRNETGDRFVGGIAVDVTERRRAEEQVRLQSLTDELTGLYNRRGFQLAAQREYDAAQREGRRSTLFVVDLDHLKRINDDHGHAAGDQALLETGELLRIAFDDQDIIGRLGGDEFAVLATRRDPEALQADLDRRLAVLNRGRTPAISLSVGWVSADRAQSLDALMNGADEALYARKRMRVA